ncbi:unnamed protein product, partial [Tilletia laevis]
PVVAPVAAEGKKPTKRKSLFGAVLAGIGGKHEDHSAAASTPAPAAAQESAAAAAAGESTDVPPITTTTNSTGVTPNTSTDAPAVPAASEKPTSNGSGGGGLAKRASILTQDLKTVLSQKSGSKEKDTSSKESGHKKSKSASSSYGAGTVGGLRSILTQPLNELPGVPPKTPAKDGGAEVEEEGDVVEGADGTTVRVHENPRFKGQPASKVNPVQWRK